MVNKLKYIFLIFFMYINILSVHCQNVVTEKSNYQVIYNLNYQKDSTDIQTKTDEKMILLIGDNYSLFESWAGRYNDSIALSLEEKGVNVYTAMEKIRSQRKSNRFNFRILKEKEKDKTIIFNSFFSDNFIYENNEILNWKLSDETKLINGYKCFSATLSYAGRNYLAWFTNEIPIPDGPYIFKGLPGLIISIEDEKQHYKFELISFEKDNEIFSFDLEDGTKISKDTFFKAYNSAKENFLSQLAQRGIEVASDDKRSLKKRVQKSRNNTIEIQY